MLTKPSALLITMALVAVPMSMPAGRCEDNGPAANDSGAKEKQQSTGADQTAAAPAKEDQAATPPAKDTNDHSDKPATRVLEGGIKGTAVPLSEGLSRISVAAVAVQDSCMKIMKEATRKDTVVMRGPNVLPNGTVIPALGGQGGVMQFGEMPIRKDKLQRYLDGSEQTMVALQSYVDALIVPADNAQAQSIYSDLRFAMQNAQDHLSRLKDLSSQKRLVNVKIGREALSIHDAMTAIERDRSQLAGLIGPSPAASGDSK
jgi:hypothetical protein